MSVKRNVTTPSGRFIEPKLPVEPERRDQGVEEPDLTRIRSLLINPY